MRTAALLLILGASHGPDPPGAVTIHFVMWKPHRPEAWDRILAEFHSANPGIRVEVEVGRKVSLRARQTHRFCPDGKRIE